MCSTRWGNGMVMPSRRRVSRIVIATSLTACHALSSSLGCQNRATMSTPDSPNPGDKDVTQGVLPQGADVADGLEEDLLDPPQIGVVAHLEGKHGSTDLLPGLVDERGLQHGEVGQVDDLPIEAHHDDRSRVDLHDRSALAVALDLVARPDRASRVDHHCGDQVAHDGLEGECDHDAGHAERPDQRTDRYVELTERVDQRQRYHCDDEQPADQGNCVVLEPEGPGDRPHQRPNQDRDEHTRGQDADGHDPFAGGDLGKHELQAGGRHRAPVDRPSTTLTLPRTRDPVVVALAHHLPTTSLRQTLHIFLASQPVDERLPTAPVAEIPRGQLHQPSPWILWARASAMVSASSTSHSSGV